jgi:hypothetical protein
MIAATGIDVSLDALDHIGMDIPARTSGCGRCSWICAFVPL